MMSKRIDPTDTLVGKNIRIFRNSKKLSQTELADAIGVSYQQVQKYETGANRIGSSRLAQIAKVLEVPVEHLFSGIKSGAAQHEIVTDLLTAPYALDLLRALSKIDDLKVRRSLVALTESIVGLAKE